MKSFSTLLCCLAMATFGWFIATSDTKPSNTASASNGPPVVLNPITQRDTITIMNTVRDTVIQVKTKTKYKVKQAPCTVCSSISATDSSACGNRKAISPDTLPTRLYRIHGTIEQVNE